MHQPRAIIVVDPFERVAEGVPEIKQSAVAPLMFVARDNRRFRFAADRNGADAVIAAGEYSAPIGLKPAEERGIADEAVFDDLRVARAKFTRRQGFQRLRVSENQGRLMKGADQVLAVLGIDPVLPPLGRIDLSEKARWKLDEAHSAPHRRGGKAREIADDAAAKGEDQIAALKLCGDQGVTDFGIVRIGFRRFPRRDDDGGVANPSRIERFFQRWKVLFRDIGVSDDRASRSWSNAGGRGRPPERSSRAR